MKADLGIALRSMKQSDLFEVHEIEKECFPSAWSMKAFEEAVESLESVVLYMLCNDAMIGYFVGFGVEDEYNIYNIAIKPKYHRRGFGWFLLNQVIENHCKRYDKYFLEVRKSNKEAIGLYYKYGFRYVYERRGYYTDPIEDALIMRYDI